MLNTQFLKELALFRSKTPKSKRVRRPLLLPLLLPKVFMRDDTKMLVMSTVLHSADVSNPCRTWEVKQLPMFATSP